ncbi:lytic murein transglycosylase [Iamia majanohamensis]|uniref:Lytic murein transglycosylase n=1 Tax=Iamia majanohamensis TaxID=467976 RepID=A0AAE9Y8S3_9ACTN|nr:lytic murein transglycosylase [Iamia majanohamensis]WCO69019.1 lytic murein transglycosylase [Iamia majanohamensis]
MAVLAVTAALVPAAPVLAERAGDLRPAAAAPDRTPAAQVPATDPDFVDEPLPTNPISPAVADIRVESAELDAVGDVVDAAQGRLDGAVGERDDLRAHIADLARERVETVDLLARRRDEEAQRGVEKVAAQGVLADRQDALDAAEEVVDEAEAAVARARDALRQLVVANYMSQGTTISDIGTVLSGQGGINDALVRLSLGESSLAARARDIDERQADLADAEDDRDAAAAARDRARAALDRAEQAERDAIAAREGTEQRIRDIDDETRRTQEAEVAAVADVAAKEAGLLQAQADVAPARLRADVVGDGIDFPLVALDAWLKAAAGAPCRVEWWMLAGISKVEGRHGTFGGGQLGARGYPTTRIIGPPLDGTGGNARIGDSDGGLWDDDAALDRAVGPMQFIPSTWRAWGRDGDGDGVADPHTFYDATAAAAAYLCAGRTDLTDEAQLRAAYLSYNRSQAYVSAVLAEGRRYQAALPLVPPHPVGVPPVVLPPPPGA